MLILLMTYLILNLYILLKKLSKKGKGVDGSDAESVEKEARFREKVERFTTRLNSIIFTLLKGVAWILSGVFTVVIVLLFIAIYYTIFDIQVLNSTSFWGVDLLIQYANLFTPQTITYVLAIAAILLICITYITISLLLKQKLNKWIIYGVIILCIALIIGALATDSVGLIPKRDTTSHSQTVESSNVEIESVKETKTK